MRLRLCWHFLIACLVLRSPVQAQMLGSELADVGLESAWVSQVSVPPNGRGVVSADVWIDTTGSRRYAIVDLPGHPMIRVAADKLNEKNLPIGMEKAKAEAQSLAAKMLGSSSGFDVAEVSVPQTRLVLVTANGLVNNFDAESGKLLWSTPCGPTNITALPAALSKHGVLIAQGDTLYVLDWITGKQLVTKRLQSSTCSAIAVIDGEIEPPPNTQREVRLNSMALISDFTGTMSSYGLTEKISPWTMRMVGRAEVRPISSPDRKVVGFGTSGMLYMFSGSTGPQVNFRYETTGGMSGGLSSGNQAFYVGNNAGVLSKVTYAGLLAWSFHLSHAIVQPALIDEELGQVYVVSESGEFTAVSDQTGYEAWDKSIQTNIKVPIAISGASVICRTMDDRLIAIDRKTGEIHGATASHSNIAAAPINRMTDRVYLVSQRGQIQALRPIGKDLPKLTRPLDSPPPKKPIQRTIEETPTTTENTDSPFGTPDTPTTNENDAFGSDPFSGGNP